MKIKWNEKYLTISVYAFIVLATSIVFYLILSRLSIFRLNIMAYIRILQPFYIGFAIAYLLNFIMEFYEKRVLSNKYVKSIKPFTKRIISIILTYITAGFLLYLFLVFILPQLVSSIAGLVNDIPSYVRNTTIFIENLIDKVDLREEYLELIYERLDEGLNYISNILTSLIPLIGNFIRSLLSSIWNIFIGLIVSIYLLADKEKFFALIKKTVYGLFPKKIAEKSIEITHRSDRIFGNFLSGKILDSTIIGILTFIILSIVNMPYTLLVSFIIGVTNVIPFFGPFIGAIPSFIIVFFVSPIRALWLLLIIFFIQQIDGNFIGPKILGDSLGISAFWILFSLMIGGKFFGFLGLIIGVPLFVLIYSIIKEIVEMRLKAKNLSVDTTDYMKK